MEILSIGRLKNKQTILLSEGESAPTEYVFTTNLDTNLYDDITSNTTWMNFGVGYYDFLFCRKQVMFRTAIIGFSALTQNEKISAAKVFAVSKPNRDEVLTEQEQFDDWDTFVYVSQRSRQQRWNKAKSYISYYLSPVDSTDLALSTEDLSKNYIEYGIESMSIDGVTGLYDWLENEFTLKPYYNETYKNNILLILQEGGLY